MTVQTNQVAQQGGGDLQGRAEALPLIVVLSAVLLSPLLFDFMQWMQSLLSHR